MKTARKVFVCMVIILAVMAVLPRASVYAMDLGKALNYVRAAVSEAGYALNSKGESSHGSSFLSPRAACRIGASTTNNLASSFALASFTRAAGALSDLGFSSGKPQSNAEAVQQLYGQYPNNDVDRVINELGNNADRLTPAQLKELVSNRLDNRPDGRPVAIVVVSNDERLNPVAYQQDIQGVVKDLQAQGYRVMFYTASNESDVVKALQDGSGNGNDPATTIVMIGHGEQSGMILDQPGSGSSELDVTDQQKLTAANVGNTLKPGGTIAFLSCSVGKGEGQGSNLVNTIASVFPNAKHVYGATEPVSDIYMRFENQQLVDVDYGTGPDKRVDAYDGVANSSAVAPAAPATRPTTNLLDIPGNVLMNALKRIEGIVF